MSITSGSSNRSEALVNPAKRIVIGFVVVSAVVVIWLGVRGGGESSRSPRGAPLGTNARRFVGKWTFVDGTMKTDWDFQTADPQKHAMSLVGKSMTVVERDGALWTALDRDSCSILLAPKGNDAMEMVPGRVVCSEQADAGKKSNAKMVELAMTLDASGRGHVAGASQFSLAASGQVHEGRLDFAGVAEKR
jgi:hypothetical protein